ncbi:hypothetical protein METY_1315 [Methylopila sp. Yamaguchi]|uniref:hypothetical protein n=1 Tax=Methylopila sp. Yamaguchi TaxID=1437817 RepID=UPI000CB1C769|nr:hypothetical protein [Methylopila sp. Yamaguchi]GBD48102.1 hypothetical protein METY_1315 [Methylopila sp. Yamaguchi]
MGEGRIPFEAIDRFAIRSGIATTHEFDRFERMIRAMDDEFLERRKPKGKDDIGGAVSIKDGAAIRDLLTKIAEKMEGPADS